MSNNSAEVRKLLERLHEAMGLGLPEAHEGMNFWLRQQARRGEFPLQAGEEFGAWVRRVARGGQ